MDPLDLITFVLGLLYVCIVLYIYYYIIKICWQFIKKIYAYFVNDENITDSKLSKGENILHEEDNNEKVNIPDLPYRRKDYFFTISEKTFFNLLRSITGNNYLIFSKVRIADLIYFSGNENSDFYHYFNKIKAKHVDFLICDNESMQPLFIIELDDVSHLREDRQERDRFVDQAFKSAGIPILHIKSAACYNQNEIAEYLSRYLSKLNKSSESLSLDLTHTPA